MLAKPRWAVAIARASLSNAIARVLLVPSSQARTNRDIGFHLGAFPAKSANGAAAKELRNPSFDWRCRDQVYWGKGISSLSMERARTNAGAASGVRTCSIQYTPS